MTRDRRVLLVLLGVSLLVSIFGSLLYVGLDKLHTTREQIEQLKKQYAKLLTSDPEESIDLREKMQELHRARDAELRRYYGRDEIDLYRFGSAVNAMLARHGIVVEQFRTATAASRSVLELSARGTSPAFMAFLSEVSMAQKYWTIPYLHIQSSSASGFLTCEFQIGYLVNEAVTKAP